MNKIANNDPQSIGGTPIDGYANYTLQQRILGCRHGWLGVYDAMVSAITGKRVREVSRDYVITFYGRGISSVQMTTEE